jgi:AraC family transcriptional regulator
MSETLPLPTLAAGPGWTLHASRTAGPFRATLKRYTAAFSQSLHVHDRGTIDLNIAGGGKGLYGRLERESKPGTVEFFSPQHEHSFRAGPSGILTMHLAFEPTLLEPGLWGTENPEGRDIDQCAALGISRRMLSELLDCDIDSHLSLESLGHELLAASVRWIERGDATAHWLRWTRERLHEEPCIGLTALAEEAGVHPAHLARSFSAQYGVTAGEYARRVRLGRAVADLAGGKPLVQVALDTGFSDQSHFTRQFRRTFGVTPGAYAASLPNRAPKRA